MTETFVGGLFLALAFVVVVPLFPLRWSLLAYLLCLHVVPDTVGYEAAVAMGSRNLLTVVILPTVLLLRTRFHSWRMLRDNRVFHLWGLFCVYVAVASLWTPYRIPALKQLGYLYGYSVLFVAMVALFMDRRVNMEKVLVSSAAWALVLAVVQTFLLGNPYGGDVSRLTSFASPQPLGLYLSLVFGLTVSFGERSRRRSFTRTLLLISILVALIMNGSRQGMFAVAMIVLFLALPIQRRQVPALLFPVILVNVLLVGSLGLRNVAGYGISPGLGAGRLAEARRFLAEGVGAVRDIGTSRARFEIYEMVLDRVSAKPMTDIIFGSGTSSAADLIVERWIVYRDYDEYTLDSNRVVHNELIRTLYEWGIVGLVLISLVMVGLLFGAIRIAMDLRTSQGFLLAFLVSIVVGIFCLLGNVLAATSTPLGAAVIFPIANLLWLQERQRSAFARDAAGCVEPTGGRYVRAAPGRTR